LAARLLGAAQKQPGHTQHHIRTAQVMSGMTQEPTAANRASQLAAAHSSGWSCPVCTELRSVNIQRGTCKQAALLLRPQPCLQTLGLTQKRQPPKPRPHTVRRLCHKHMHYRGVAAPA
jgi:hypothetical protein